MDNRETGMGEANVPLRLKERNCIGEKFSDSVERCYC